MIRVLLVGCGKIGTVGHLPALKELQDQGLAQVTACDADPAKAKAAGSQFGFPTVTDWESAAGDADAVSVCLPPGPNAEVAAAAARRGLHVLCEKPPGRNVEQAAALAAAAAANPSAVTMVAFNRRFNPLYRRALDASLALGPPTSFYGRFSRAGLGSAPDDTATDWILSSSSHALDLAVATMGYPKAVSVSRRTLGSGPDNVWTIHLHTDAGAALLFLHYAAGRRVERFEWAGPGYDVSLDLPERAEWAQSGRQVETWPVENPAYHHAFGFFSEYRAFLAAIAEEGPRPACDFRYAPDFMRLVDTILDAPDGALRPVPAPDERGLAAVAPVAGAGAGAAAAERRERPVVLLNHPLAVQPRFFSMDTLSQLRARCDVRSSDDPKAWTDAQALVTGRGVKTPPDLAERAPNLELVVAIGASVRNLATPELLDRGVAVCNTADAVAQSVAEHCLLLALAGLRRLPQTDRAMRAGEWPRPGGAGSSSGGGLRDRLRALPIPPEVRSRLGALERKALERLRPAPAASGGGKKGGLGGASDLRGVAVTLVGWGHTARRFAELLVPFGGPVLVVSDAAREAELEAVGARRASLGEALAAANVVSLHKGLTDETRGFLGERELALLRPGTVLVNVARGELIDEDALLARLAQGDIIAALDVYNEEPLPKDHPLRSVANAILTPHHASTTVQEERRMGEQALATVLAWADGLPIDALDQGRLAKMT